MKEVTILLNSITKIKDFTNAIRNVPEDMDIISGKYLINAKSIMGIFSIDVAKPITLRIMSDDNNRVNEILSIIKDYIVE